MTWLWIAILAGIGVAVARVLIAQRRGARIEAAAAAAQEALDAEQAARKKTKKKKRKRSPADAPPEASTAAPVAAPVAAAATPAIPSTWGWAKVHLAEANLKALGYYYRDSRAGYSFKILVDLRDQPSDEAIRDAARASNYVANSTHRLGAHDTAYAGAREAGMGAMTEASFERGAGASGPSCAIVMMLTNEEKRLYALPDAMPGIEIYAATR